MNAPSRREQTTVPAALRRPATLAVVIAGLIVSVLAVRYAGGTTPRWLDLRIDTALDGLPADAGGWQALLDLGRPVIAVASAAALAGIACALGRHRIALLAVLGPALTGGAILLLKPIVGRTLRGDLAFPSGQAAAATAFGLVAGLLMISMLRAPRWGAAALLGLSVLVSGGVTGLALIVRDWHYPTDTIGGLCTAVATVLATALSLDRWCRRTDGR